MNCSKNNANFKRFNTSKNDDLETKLTQWVHSKNWIQFTTDNKLSLCGKVEPLK